MCVFFNDTATTEIYTLSLHDALPISSVSKLPLNTPVQLQIVNNEPRALYVSVLVIDPTGEITIIFPNQWTAAFEDRKSTRLNSSHANISYAVFCLKKKKLLTNEIAHV